MAAGTDTAAAMSDREILILRIIDAPRELVFQALAPKN